MITVRALVEGLGGGVAVAREMGVTPSAVAHWIAENQVPPGRRLKMWALAVARGVEWTPPDAEGLVLTPREAA